MLRQAWQSAGEMNRLGAAAKQPLAVCLWRAAYDGVSAIKPAGRRQRDWRLALVLSWRIFREAFEVECDESFGAS
jgi:hypothetical protein